ICSGWYIGSNRSCHLRPSLAKRALPKKLPFVRVAFGQSRQTGSSLKMFFDMGDKLKFVEQKIFFRFDLGCGQDARSETVFDAKRQKPSLPKRQISSCDSGRRSNKSFWNECGMRP